MRFGLIGYGAWGQHHASAIAAVQGARLTAIAAKSEASRARARREHPSAAVYADYREILARADIDAVDVVLPTHLHAEVAAAALASGKHVLLEKPMALTVEECDRLIQAARDSGKVLSIGHEFRLSSQWGAIKGLIERGEIGTPLYALVTLFRFPYRRGAEDWRYELAKVGSWILEEPIHFFDFVLWFFEQYGDPISVVAHGNSKGREEGLYDHFTSIVKFRGGPYAVITQCLSGFEHHQVVEIAGSGGAIRTTWSGAMDRTLEPRFALRAQRVGAEGPRDLDLFTPSGEVFELREELRRVVRAFATGEALYPPESGRKLVRICLEAERSLREGREIRLE